MNNIFGTLPSIGELVVLTEYYVYDEPLLFLCQNSAQQKFIVLAADRKNWTGKWLVVAISEDRLLQMEGDEITLYDIFKNPQSGFILLTATTTQEGKLNTKEMLPTDFTEDVFPTKGEYLKASAETKIITAMKNPEMIKLPQTDKLHILKIIMENLGLTATDLKRLSN